MHPKYPHMFNPLRMGPIEVPNRFYFSAHGTPLTIGTRPSDDFLHYNLARVKGGTGLIVSSVVVHDRGVIFQPSAYPPENVSAFRAMAEAIHDAGGRIFAEIWNHWGCKGQWQPLSPPAPGMTASPAQIAWGGNAGSTHGMTRHEIHAMIDSFRQTTMHLRQAGFDGVMLHGAHAAMLEQFASPYFNRRTDEYGGNLENRLRFVVEALQAARDGAEGQMAVGMRLNCDEMLPGGYDIGGAREILTALCGRGLLDFVDLDVAVEPQQDELGMPAVFMEKQFYRPWVEAVRSAAGDVPVMSVLGRLTSIAEGEEALAAGVCDMVGATRALIAEPELVRNAREDREEHSRTCIACNWCVGAAAEGAAGCAINPASYRERLWGVDSFAPAPRASKVIVVGGGPGGLEAARVCALRGHVVTLIEARERLGGGLAQWAALPGREFFFKSVEWWESELERLGVVVQRGTRATADMILAESPDAVIVATGAPYSRSGRSAFLDIDIPGHEQDFVYRPEDIILGGARPRGKVILLDGEGLNASLGTAELLGAAGASVEYMTPGFSPIAPRITYTLEAPHILKRLRAAGVTFTPSTYIRRIGDREVVAYDTITEEERTISGVDAVVLSTGRLPLDELAHELEGKVAQLYVIGDALASRPLAAAAYEGQKFARYVGEPDAPATVGEAYFRRNDPAVIPQPADVPRQTTAG